MQLFGMAGVGGLEGANYPLEGDGSFSKVGFYLCPYHLDGAFSGGPDEFAVWVIWVSELQWHEVGDGAVSVAEVVEVFVQLFPCHVCRREEVPGCGGNVAVEFFWEDAQEEHVRDGVVGVASCLPPAGDEAGTDGPRGCVADGLCWVGG